MSHFGHDVENADYIPFTPDLMHALEMFEEYDGHIPETSNEEHHIKVI